MPETPPQRPALIGTLAFIAISWGGAAVYVAAHGGIGSGDLRAFAFWCVLLAVPTFLALRIFDRLSGVWSVARIYMAAGTLGVLAGVASTLGVASILGGWIGAFSFPVFLCWLAGSLVAYGVVALLRRPGTWPIALLTVVVPFFGVVATLAVLLAQPLDLLVHVKHGTTSEQVARIVDEVLGEPHPSGHGHSLIEGLASVGPWDTADESRIRVTFRPGTSAKRRAEVVQRVLASPLVSRTSDLDPNTSADVGGTLNSGRK